MRKILLATTALVAFAGAAQAAESPIQVTLGGYVDFRAALFHESDKLVGNQATPERRGGDFMTEYGLDIAAEGKAAHGVTYGATVYLTNDDEPTSEIKMEEAYVWLSGAFGKVIMGDERGATDLFVYAPTVGDGQVDGNYMDFLSNTTFATAIMPSYIDNTETATKVTYYTPKVGNANHKVQLGVSYAPEAAGAGYNTTKFRRDIDGYRDVVEATMQYTGTFSPVSVVISPMMVTAEGESNAPTEIKKDYTAYGVGAQAMYAGFTLGGSYVDVGHMNTLKNSAEEKDQQAWTVGLTYGFDKVSVGASYLNAEGYFDLSQTNAQVAAGTTSTQYVDNIDVYGVGAAYTWFPGMVSSADAIFFDQNREDSGRNNIGHVLLLSQKMSF